MKKPWYKPFAGGQGRTAEDVERDGELLMLLLAFMAGAALIAAALLLGGAA